MGVFYIISCTRYSINAYSNIDCMDILYTYDTTKSIIVKYLDWCNIGIISFGSKCQYRIVDLNILLKVEIQ